MDDRPEYLHISKEDWERTPLSVRKAFELLLQEVQQLRARVEDLEARLNRNSSNSNQPPSTDSPFKKPGEQGSGNKKKKQKRGGQKGHKGHKQELLEPTHEEHVYTTQCPCGGTELIDKGVYYTHQEIELPEIRMTVNHFLLHEQQCSKCSQTLRARIPSEHRTGYGPRLSAMIGEVSGIQGNSRETVQSFCRSVLGFHISIGAIQNVVDRVSEAIVPHYGKIGEYARNTEINHIDETTWKSEQELNWIWLMANAVVAFFMVHTSRSKEAFEKLIGKWTGILISDNYGVYQNWVGMRQKCLAHLIRTAKGLSEHGNPEIAKCGSRGRDELRRLLMMAKDPPTVGQWRAWYARTCKLIKQNRHRKDKAGTFVRSLEKEMEALWVFLHEEGVEPTNNHAERMLRYAVLWRKRSLGTQSEKGNRWVERILSLRQTCRLNGKSSFEVLCNAMSCHFKGQEPDLSWIGAK
jgi:transposase